MEVDTKNEGSSQQTKMKRKNGKTLYKLKEQMEFYFSNSNLEKDRFLGKLVRDTKDGYVNLEVIQTFHKIRRLSNNVKDIIKAVSNSDVLELNADSTKVRRKDPWDSNTYVNSDDRTIYVERLPTHADYRFVKNVFQRFGSVAYISLPHFRNTRKSKGFAFVEFVNEESAIKACESYKTDETVATNEQTEKKLYKEKHIKDNSPHRLARRRSKIEVEKYSEKGSKASCSSQGPSFHKADKSSRKRMKSISDSENTPKKATVSSTFDFKPRAITVTSKSSQAKKPKDLVVKPRTEIGDSNMPSEQFVPSSKATPQKRISFVDEGPLLKKAKIDTSVDKQESEKNCEQKKIEIKTKTKETVSEGLLYAETKDEQQDSNILKNETKNINQSVIPKHNVKIENEELEDSKKEVETVMEDVKDEEIKKDVETKTEDVKKEEKSKRKRKKPSDSEKLKLRVISKVEWKAYRNKYLTLQRTTMSRIKKMLLIQSQRPYVEETMEEFLMPAVDELPKTIPQSDIPFVPGVIVKIKLSSQNEKASADLKKEVRSTVDVAYVDAPEGREDMFIRFANSDKAAVSVTNKQLEKFGSVTLLKGFEETKYWEKIKADREALLNRPRPKIRGKDKVVAKAAKMIQQKNTHIYFDT